MAGDAYLATVAYLSLSYLFLTEFSKTHFGIEHKYFILLYSGFVTFNELTDDKLPIFGHGSHFHQKFQVESIV